MENNVQVVRRKRLLAAFIALVFTLMLTTVLYTARDFHREPDLHWFNGGEIQITGALLIGGGVILLVTYIFFVTPLVLLWPIRSQLKHWYAMLVISMTWPPLLDIIRFWHDGPLYALKEIRRFPVEQLWFELIALCACGTYLLLLRWQLQRHRKI